MDYGWLRVAALGGMGGGWGGRVLSALSALDALDAIGDGLGMVWGWQWVCGVYMD